MTIKKMDFSWIMVSDIKKAEKFFSDTLGLQLVCSSPEYGWLEFIAKEGGSMLGVAQANNLNPDEKPGQNAVITMTTNNILETKSQLEFKGVKFNGDIIEIKDHVKLANFTDDNGNKFQLVEKILTTKPNPYK